MPACLLARLPPVNWECFVPISFVRRVCLTCLCSSLLRAAQLVRDSMCKERRQELFSFAAASVLELGLPERLALLECRDTAARLQFVAVACQPHLQDLVARVSLQQALVKP